MSNCVFLNPATCVVHPRFPINQSPKQGLFGLHEPRTARVRYKESEVMKEAK